MRWAGGRKCLGGFCGYLKGLVIAERICLSNSASGTGLDGSKSQKIRSMMTTIAKYNP